MDDSHESPSRRRFLGLAGAAAASTALLQAMTGAIPASAAPATPLTSSGKSPRSPKAPANGKSVLILGAGIAGLAAAYRLLDKGYEVRILEAQGRAGGRNFTARRGSEVTEFVGGGTTTRTCEFDEGLYLNMGPGRIPYHHRRVIRACQELGVKLEPYVMETTANLYHGTEFGDPAIPNRRIANDTRGHIAQWLVASLKKGSESTDGLCGDERNAFYRLLQHFGDLDKKDFSYHGSTRSGNGKPLSVSQPPVAPPALGLKELLAGDFWSHHFYQPTDFLWQHTMFQPVGGMDKIVEGFVAGLFNVISLNAPVTRIELGDSKVRVRVSEGGSAQWFEADYCLSNIPLPLLKTLDKDGFTPEFLDAVGTPSFAPACKVGWQANERFWEGDDYEIYGGISWLHHEITQVWYPSNDYFSDKGTLTGAYNFYKKAETLGARTHAERLAVAREGGARLHKEFKDQQIIPDRLGMSIAWHKVPYQAGGWADWRCEDRHHVNAYTRLLAPDKERFFVIGDQVSCLPGWQEGALMSAEHVVGQVTSRQRVVPPVVQRIPDSRRLTTGTAED